VSLLKNIFWGNNTERAEFNKQLKNVLGFVPGRPDVYIAALSHRSIKETSEENNERLEYLGDAVLGSIIADFLYKRYPKKGEGFLTEMRSKMVNRQQLNDIALKMGLKKITRFNKIDGSLKNSHIFGNTLEALVGAIYIDKGYKRTQNWVMKRLIIPHLFMDDLELLDINIKNRLIGWATKNNRTITFDIVEEKLEKSRRLFVIGVMLDGEVIATGKGFNKKDASQLAAQAAVAKLEL
jgi:ribonuclease III